MENASRPLTSDTLKRLAKLMDKRSVDLLVTANLMNLNLKYPGPSKPESKYDSFDFAQALIRASHILDLADEDDMIIALSRRVADALGAGLMEPISKRRTQPHIAAIPHPGGTNRWYNDPENRESVSLYLKEMSSYVTWTDPGWLVI